MQPRRIMHVTHNMDFGGTEQVIQQVISGIKPHNYVSQVVCIDGSVGQMGQQMKSRGLSVDSIARGSGLDINTILALRSLIKQADIDILHCHQYTPFCYGALAAIGTGIKVVFTEHGRFHPDRYTWKRRIVNQLLRRLADRITCISKATRAALARYEWIPEKEVAVIYNGVDVPQLNQAKNSVRRALGIQDATFVLGTIARLDPIKNQRMMIDAFVQLQTAIPESVLIIAGDGPERAMLEQHADEYGVADFVFFTGFVTDIADYLCAFDVFLLTSFSEGTSMTLLEAMAMRTPIIATEVGGNSEVIEHDLTGRLIPSGDVAALVKNLKDLESDSSIRGRLSRDAKTSFDNRFSKAVMTKAYLELYEAL